MLPGRGTTPQKRHKLIFQQIYDSLYFVKRARADLLGKTYVPIVTGATTATGITILPSVYLYIFRILGNFRTQYLARLLRINENLCITKAYAQVASHRALGTLFKLEFCCFSGEKTFRLKKKRKKKKQQMEIRPCFEREL